MIAPLLALLLVALAVAPAAEAADDGRITFRRDRDIFTAAPTGGALRQLTGGKREYAYPSLSADGRQIAHVGFSPLGGDGQILVMDADGADQRALTRRRTNPTDLAPALSPTGSRVLFTRNYYTSIGPVLVVAPVYGARARRLPTGGVPVNAAAWSRDGRTIAFTARRRDPSCGGTPNCFAPQGDLYVMRADGSDLRQIVIRSNPRGVTLPGLSSTPPSFSPDGQRLAFAGEIPQRGPVPQEDGIFTVRTDGSDLRQVTRFVHTPEADDLREGCHQQPSYSPAGNEIVFTKGACSSAQSVWRVRTDGSGLTPVVRGGWTSWARRATLAPARLKGGPPAAAVRVSRTGAFTLPSLRAACKPGGAKCPLAVTTRSRGGRVLGRRASRLRPGAGAAIRGRLDAEAHARLRRATRMRVSVSVRVRKGTRTASRRVGVTLRAR